MPEERLTRQILSSWAIPRANAARKGGNCFTTRRSLQDALVAAKIVPPDSAAPLASWIPQLAHPSAKKGIEDAVKNLEDRTLGSNVR